MAPAQAHGGGSLSDRHPISQEYQQPGTAGDPRRDGRGTLPRQQGQAFRWGEADGERGFATTSHTAPLCKMGIDGYKIETPYLRPWCCCRGRVLGCCGLPPLPPWASLLAWAPRPTPLLALAGLVDRQLASPQRRPVQPCNRRLGLCGIRHLDKG